MNSLMHRRSQNSKGFSLVELLCVIGILGIITSLAVPLLAAPLEKSREERDQYNAQQIINAANSAAAIGDSTVSHCATKEEAIQKLTEGVGGQGPMRTTVIRLAKLEGPALTRAAALLKFDNGQMSLLN